MSSNELSYKSRSGMALIALVALATAALAVALAAPAHAAAGKGSAAIVLAAHNKGRTLSGQGVTVIAAAPAVRQNKTLTLPIAAVDPGSAASASAEGVLRFKHGKRSAWVSELRFDLAGGTLVGKLGKETMPIFWLGATPNVDQSSGAVSLDKGKLLLTGKAAKALKAKLGLNRALARKGVGMAWLAAQADPTHAAAQALVSGQASWGVLASWRAYILGNFGPGSIGSMAVDGGATASGALTDPATVFGFPAAGGSFERGLYGATDRLSLRTAGSVIFAKPGHCIIEVKLSDLELTIDGPNSSIGLDSIYDIDTPAGMSCTDEPAVPSSDVDFATLDTSGVTPSYSADGKTITWSEVPATLTAAGAKAFGAGYPEGQALDPVTITATVG